MRECCQCKIFSAMPFISYVMCMHTLCGDVNAAGNNIYIKCSIADQEGKNHHRKFIVASRFNLHCISSQQTRELQSMHIMIYYDMKEIAFMLLGDSKQLQI